MNREAEKDCSLAEEAARAVLQHDTLQSHNPMNARCGLEDCDCEYTIGGLLRRLELIAEEALNTVRLTRRHTSLCDSSCPCFQAGYEAEHRPPGP